MNLTTNIRNHAIVKIVSTIVIDICVVFILVKNLRALKGRTTTFTQWPKVKVLKSRADDRPLGASSLDSLEFRNEVCVLGWPPSFLAVPHYIILAQLSVRTLSEPDVPC